MPSHGVVYDEAQKQRRKQSLIARAISKMRHYSTQCIVENLNRFVVRYPTTENICYCSVLERELYGHAASGAIVFYAHADTTVMGMESAGGLVDYPIEEENVWPFQQCQWTDDCLLAIAEYLDLVDRLACRSVCQQWRRIFSHAALWTEPVEDLEERIDVSLAQIYPDLMQWTAVAQFLIITPRINCHYFFGEQLWLNRRLVQIYVRILWREWYGLAGKRINIERHESLERASHLYIRASQGARTLTIQFECIEDEQGNREDILFWVRAITHSCKD